MRKKESNTGPMVLVLIVGLIVGAMLGGGMIENSYIKKVRKLGGAICEEEYDMDFESYNDEVLKCKNKIVDGHYDGLKVVKVK